MSNQTGARRRKVLMVTRASRAVSVAILEPCGHVHAAPRFLQDGMTVYCMKCREGVPVP